MQNSQDMCVQSLDQEDPQGEGMGTQVSILAWKFCGQRSLEGCSPWGHESDTTKQLSMHVYMYTYSMYIRKLAMLQHYLKKGTEIYHLKIFLLLFNQFRDTVDELKLSNKHLGKYFYFLEIISLIQFLLTVVFSLKIISQHIFYTILQRIGIHSMKSHRSSSKVNISTWLFGQNIYFLNSNFLIYKMRIIIVPFQSSLS